ncbi:hypothetical protein RHE_PE00235 (plasmid) [Rhizobium etli CFN 42]|uniref:Uncharacterized protein n=1 Tax=Rhizobium etli (strain ATCC 51251 / DSM 11541 / JCM 21823 / NBRC 15573 / CFN 42) TaxID=347834 RepID=Q2K0M4_RHIEC|nr:hypothetical protein RHE_PE00235 [Rhizobium etli CFN 42]
MLRVHAAGPLTDAALGRQSRTARRQSAKPAADDVEDGSEQCARIAAENDALNRAEHHAPKVEAGEPEVELQPRPMEAPLGSYEAKKHAKQERYGCKNCHRRAENRNGNLRRGRRRRIGTGVEDCVRHCGSPSELLMPQEY